MAYGRNQVRVEFLDLGLRRLIQEDVCLWVRLHHASLSCLALGCDILRLQAAALADSVELRSAIRRLQFHSLRTRPLLKLDAANVAVDLVAGLRQIANLLALEHVGLHYRLR